MNYKDVFVSHYLPPATIRNTHLTPTRTLIGCLKVTKHIYVHIWGVHACALVCMHIYVHAHGVQRTTLGIILRHCPTPLRQGLVYSRIG